MAGMIGLAAVVADAAMIDSVIGLDVRRDDERAVPGARMGRGGGALPADDARRPRTQSKK